MREELSKLQFLRNAMDASEPDVELPLCPKVVKALRWRASLFHAEAISALLYGSFPAFLLSVVLSGR